MRRKGSGPKDSGHTARRPCSHCRAQGSCNSQAPTAPSLRSSRLARGQAAGYWYLETEPVRRKAHSLRTVGIPGWDESGPNERGAWRAPVFGPGWKGSGIGTAFELAQARLDAITQIKGYTVNLVVLAEYLAGLLQVAQGKGQALALG